GIEQSHCREVDIPADEEGEGGVLFERVLHPSGGFKQVSCRACREMTQIQFAVVGLELRSDSLDRLLKIGTAQESILDEGGDLELRNRLAIQNPPDLPFELQFAAGFDPLQVFLQFRRGKLKELAEIVRRGAEPQFGRRSLAAPLTEGTV